MCLQILLYVIVLFINYFLFLFVLKINSKTKTIIFYFNIFNYILFLKKLLQNTIGSFLSSVGRIFLMVSSQFILSFPFCVFQSVENNDFLLVFIPLPFFLFSFVLSTVNCIGYRNVTANNNTDWADEDSDSYKLV